MTQPHLGLQLAINEAGSARRLGEIVGCTKQNINRLLREGKPLPAKYVLAAERALTIPRHVLNPEIYPRPKVNLDAL